MDKEDFAEKFNMLVEDVKEIKRRTEKIDDLATGFSDLKQENETLRKRIENLEIEKHEMQKRINESEQYSRRNNVIITGLPKDTKEDLREKVTKLAGKLGVKLHEYDICTVHRLSNIGEAPAIVMKMNNRDKKTHLMKEARKKKLKANDFGYSSNEYIFLSEHLTKENNELLFEAKEKLKIPGYVKFVWPCDGQVLCREDERARITRIENFAHLQEIAEVYRGEYQETERATEDDYSGEESGEERVGDKRDQGADGNEGRKGKERKKPEPEKDTFKKNWKKQPPKSSQPRKQQEITRFLPPRSNRFRR